MQQGTSADFESVGARGEVDTYIARVAHELTAPVSLISGSLENLQESLRMLVQYVEATEKILGRNDEIARLRADLRLDYRLENTPGLLRICSEGAQRLSHVVTQLRFHSRRAEHGAAAGRADVGAVLRETLALALHGHGERPEVELEITREPLVAVGRGDFLAQVFLNLVRNALDALEGHPAPRLSLRAQILPGACEGGSAAVEVRVRDHGSGIPEAARHRIFEEFFTTKPAHAGLGLGLSISRDILHAVGGRLELAETGPQGTEFVVTLRAA